MKRTLFILGCISLALASCGGNDTSKSSEESTTTATTSTTTAPAASSSSSSSSSLPGEKLINKADCIGCHNKTEKVIGPAYVEIAAKYPATDANIDLLADKIIKGGKGVWGEMPMTPHPSITTDNAKDMVKYILSLKK